MDEIVREPNPSEAASNSMPSGESARKRRRWFRFSLRTLFVVVTLFGIWLGFQFDWIRKRHNYLAEHPRAMRYIRPTDKPASSPSLLWIFGEPGIAKLVLQSPGFWRDREERKRTPSSEAAAVRKLFPEAEISVLEGDTVYNTWYPGTGWKWGKQ